MLNIRIDELFDSKNLKKAIKSINYVRSIYGDDSLHIILDSFANAKCLFIRCSSNKTLELTLTDVNIFEQAPFGGLFAQSSKPSSFFYWLPKAAYASKFTSGNQITEQNNVNYTSLVLNIEKVSISISPISDQAIDFVIWRFDNNTHTHQIQEKTSIDSVPYFLWGSHSQFKKSSDLYNYIIFGTVYDLRYSWPQNKRCFSENEAHALYTVYAGLEKQTGKIIYRYFQQQLVLSVMHRQSEDGGWYHGMWTDASECHYRLHTSGVHLLLDEFEKTQCPTVKVALENAVHFLSRQTDKLDCGVWFLHDSLELSEQAMNAGPFRWIPNRTLAKSVSNMLVLNTHLDATIAINRYAKLTGDRQYDELVQSALQSTRTVLSMQPANWLYKPLFWAIGLTMLPTDVASQLPLPIRAIKRFAANYLIKKLPDIKARFPRLVMPNGYIDRELSLRTWAIDYQTINLMDLARHAYAFPGQFDEAILDKALEFTQKSGLIKRYSELPEGKRYAPGFWVEALYYRCLTKPDMKYREWLAEATIYNFESGLGLSPSLLGNNGEAINTIISAPPALTVEDDRLFVITIAGCNMTEYILINFTDKEISLSNFNHNMQWMSSKYSVLSQSDLKIYGRDWIIGKLEIADVIT